MTSRKAWIAGILGVAMATPVARAQVPAAAPGAGPLSSATAVAGGPGGGATAAAVAGPTTLWSFLGLSPASLAACKAKLCSCQIGQMLNSMLAGPGSAVTGGILHPLCPTVPTQAQADALAAVPGGGGAMAVAAKIKIDEAEAKARVAAVEYLATVDCSRWSDARTALIGALRADKNECVRFAAARALNTGCCCSRETIEELRICIAGENTDGNPAETSPRVKAAAFTALQNCLMRVPEVIPAEAPPPVRIEPETAPGATPATPAPLQPEAPAAAPAPTSMNRSSADRSHVAASYIAPVDRATFLKARLQRKTFAQTVEDAQRSLMEASQNRPNLAILPTGKQSVFHAFRKARHDLNHVQHVPAYPPPNGGDVAPDPGVRPTTYVPPSSSSAPASASSSTPSADGSADVDPAGSETDSKAKHGLVGLLFKSRNR